MLSAVLLKTAGSSDDGLTVFVLTIALQEAIEVILLVRAQLLQFLAHSLRPLDKFEEQLGILTDLSRAKRPAIQ